MLKFLIYLGTSRKNNYTQHIANFVLQTANQRKDIKAELITSTTLDIDFTDEGESAATKSFKDKVATADGYIVVSPEYNHGYPATLKYILDLNLKEYIHKPVSFVGVSEGPWGGVRMIESLVPITRELGMVASFADVAVSHVKEEVKDDKLIEPEKWAKRINTQLDELTWLAKTLKYGRENFSSKYHQK